ncbi:MAG TPA: PadR family transcriptional regulator [Candidatus Saccharimonadales bacterium]|nr:PadR family transcriptional regulator [Candidatus Saccharimonadales bacterium]
MKQLSKYEQALLDGWESIYKMGQLSLWVMLALKHGAKHMSQIKKFIGESTAGALTADDKSIYRALRKYDKAELIRFDTKANATGPDLKVYSLTETGERVLEQFLDRNVRILYKSKVRELIEKG